MGRKKRPKPTTTWGKIWHFIWHEDSLASWVANIVIAFLLIKFIIYPLLGAVLGTSLPVVAVVSESMDHDYTKMTCKSTYQLCGQTSPTRQSVEYWDVCGEWYEDRGIVESDFDNYIFKNGFKKGDIIILKGKEPADIEQGDVIVFQSRKPYPIIHRVIEKEMTPAGYIFQTKGDHNPSQITASIDPLLDETQIHESLIIGTASGKIPLLGWVKVGLVDLIQGKNC